MSDGSERESERDDEEEEAEIEGETLCVSGPCGETEGCKREREKRGHGTSKVIAKRGSEGK